MAKSQKNDVTKITAPNISTAIDEKVSSALKQASNRAKKQLAQYGLKLPTQSWISSAIRNPVREL